MDLEHFSDENGIVLRRHLVALGIDDKAIRRAIDSGRIVRLRAGAYALAAIWEAADAVARHRLTASAVRLVYDEGVALSHVSACLEYGAPTWQLDLSRVHLTSLDGRGERTAAGVVHHRGSCGVLDVTRDEQGWITAPTRTALDTACSLSQEPAVVLLDWFLHEGLTTKDELELGRTAMHRWPDSLSLRRAVQLADGSAESVGESRFRLLCRRFRLPAPIAQYEIRHPNGKLAGRVDFAWPEHRLIVEFDGREKYHRFRRPGESLEEAIMREKDREDLLRELTGWRVVRITWADLARPAETIARLRRALGIAA